MSFIDDALDVIDEFVDEARKKFKKDLRETIKVLLNGKPETKEVVKKEDPLKDYEVIDIEVDKVPEKTSD